MIYRKAKFQDIEAIFGSSNANSENPFEASEPAQEITEEKQKAALAKMKEALGLCPNKA